MMSDEERERAELRQHLVALIVDVLAEADLNFDVRELRHAAIGGVNAVLWMVGVEKSGQGPPEGAAALLPPGTVAVDAGRLAAVETVRSQMQAMIDSYDLYDIDERLMYVSMGQMREWITALTPSDAATWADEFAGAVPELAGETGQDKD